jgi:hypothetical protein
VLVELFFPKSALPDFSEFLRLTADQFKELSDRFDAPESVVAYGEFVNRIANELGVPTGTARAVARVGTFLLSAIDQGTQPDSVVDDVRCFLTEMSGAESDLAAAVDAKRGPILAFLKRKPRRERAIKIEYLKSGPHPSATSFRTVCDLRPLFNEEGNAVEGLIPTLFLEIKTEDQDGEIETQVIHLSRKRLAELRQVLDRADKKLGTLQKRYEQDLLSD